MSPQTDLPSINLKFKEGSSDKFYNVKLVEEKGGYWVEFAYGRVGNAANVGRKNSSPLSYEQAVKAYEDIVKEKKKKGYTEDSSGIPFALTERAGEVTGMKPQLLNSLSDEELAEFLDSPDWFMQEKLDGVRCMIRVEKGTVTASGRPGLKTSISPNTETAAAGLPDGVYDGELIGETYHVFDILQSGDEDISRKPVEERWAALYSTLASAKIQSPYVLFVAMFMDPDDKIRAFHRIYQARGEGVVFKKKGSPYSAGRPASGGNQRKFKFQQTCTARVLGKHSTKRSVTLGLFGRNVGNVAVPPNQEIPETGSLVEVRYLYCYPNGCLFQPYLIGLRTDLDVEDSYDSLKFKAGGGEDEEG